jgi:hypothetical protein
MTRFVERLPGGRRLRDGRYIFWWVEILAVAIFYFVYSTVRNTTAKAGDAEAFRHAKEIIRIEHYMGLYHEQTLQEWALHFRPLIIACNYFYGSLHFVVTIAAAVYLFRRWSDDYPLYRNTLGVATALALIGFATYPLMPPRLLHGMDPSYGFVDTLAKYPTFWSFNSGAVSRISNQFAAMPSVHCAWAGWCAIVFAPRVKHTWQKVLAIAYPFFTMTVIVLTANHYIVDAFGGFAVLGIGFLIASLATRAGRGEPVPATSDLHVA